MTIAAYIQSMTGKFGIAVNDNELTALFIDLDISESEVYSKTTSQKAKKALVSLLNQLLLAAKTVKEGDMSISNADQDGIIAFCKILCKEAGIENPFEASIIVEDKSYLW